VSDFFTFRGAARPPTWAERDRINELRAQGIQDVYLEPDQAPQEFWEALLATIDYYLAPSMHSTGGRAAWDVWQREVVYATGWRFRLDPRETFVDIVQSGMVVRAEGNIRASVGERFAAIEHLVDTMSGDDAFEERVNDRARWFRVGVRIENGRFVPITSEHLHTEIVQPTLLLLSHERFAEVDGLYRKAFERVQSGDASGAITVATSAVEEMLRVLMPSMKGHTLSQLAEKARADGIIGPAVEEFVKKLYALRPDSDAHAGGTSDHDLAMLAIHLAGSILLYLGKTEP
jgi:hypothetical protein